MKELASKEKRRCQINI